jgi:hypothetical protein
MMLSLPENLSLVDAQSILNAYASDILAKDKIRREKELILNCDVAFAEYEKSEMPIFGPLVRAKTYIKVHSLQEIGGFVFSNDSRRPVRMRGSLTTMIAAYSRSSQSSTNGYCYAVFRRYLKMSKTTILYQNEINAFFASINMKLVKKYWPRNFREFYAFHGMVVIGGKIVFLNENQLAYVRRLQSIIVQTKKLDKAVAA